MESRNGRDVKIDILDDYIRTSERFRVIRVFFGVPESYGKSYWALMGHTGKAPKGGCTPPHGLVRIGLGRGGGRPLPSFSFSLPFSYSSKERRSPTPGGSRTPPLARPPPRPPASPLAPLYTGAGGTPWTILHLDDIVAVLRRSPASVEHHHRHHAVVLTELSLKTWLDRSSRDVIELNVC